MVNLYTGHLYPGGLFLVLGLWWSIKTAIRCTRGANGGASERKLQACEHEKSSGHDSKQRRRGRLFSLWRHGSILHHRFIELILTFALSAGGICIHSTEVLREYPRIEGEGGVVGNSSSAAVHTARLGDNDLRVIMMDNELKMLIYRNKHHVALYMAFFIATVVNLMIYFGMQLPHKLGMVYA